MLPLPVGDARRGPLWSVLFCVVGTGFAACGPPPPVIWEGTHRVEGIVAPGATLVIAAGGVPAVRAGLSPLRWPEDTVACPGTQVAASVEGDTIVAVWWSASSAQSLVLRLARSPDGGITWEEGLTIGGAVPGSSGCRRPPSGLAVDGTTGTVHVAYHGSDGDRTGILARRISRGATRAATRAADPDLVAASGTPVLAAVAAAGDTVIVAFESADSGESTVWLAIWTRTPQIPVVVGAVSEPGVRAFAPVAAIRAGQLAVAWIEARRGAVGPTVVARVGRFNR